MSRNGMQYVRLTYVVARTLRPRLKRAYPSAAYAALSSLLLYTSHTSMQVIERLDRFVPFSNPGDTGLFDNILYGARQLYLVLNLR